MPLPGDAPIWVWVLSILVSGGLLGYIRDWLRQRKIDRRTPEPVQEIMASNASLDIVARARDELEADNRRLRRTIEDERSYGEHMNSTLRTERLAWEGREERYRAEIRRLNGIGD